jgi:hypothetical protein
MNAPSQTPAPSLSDLADEEVIALGVATYGPDRALREYYQRIGVDPDSSRPDVAAVFCRAALTHDDSELRTYLATASDPLVMARVLELSCIPVDELALSHGTRDDAVRATFDSHIRPDALALANTQTSGATPAPSITYYDMEPTMTTTPTDDTGRAARIAVHGYDPESFEYRDIQRHAPAAHMPAPHFDPAGYADGPADEESAEKVADRNAIVGQWMGETAYRRSGPGPLPSNWIEVGPPPVPTLFNR